MARRPRLGGIVAGIFVLVVAAVCIRLGLWQLERLDERQARNAVYSAAIGLPVLELTGDTLRAVRSRPEDFLYRRARARGEPDPGGEVVWRGRSSGGRPGVNILRPYTLESGTILVNRGWAASPDAAHVQLDELSAPDPDPVGVLVPMAAAPGEARPIQLEIDGDSALSVRIPDYGTLARRIPGLLPLYLQMLPSGGEPSEPVPLPLPDLADEGPHLGYAVQWFSFAAIACIGFASAVFLRRRSARA